jgi:hypothetical protein
MEILAGEGGDKNKPNQSVRQGKLVQLSRYESWPAKDQPTGRNDYVRIRR